MTSGSDFFDLFRQGTAAAAAACFQLAAAYIHIHIYIYIHISKAAKGNMKAPTPCRSRLIASSTTAALTCTTSRVSQLPPRTLVQKTAWTGSQLEEETS